MLVYANSFAFEPDNNTPAAIIQLVAKWVGNRSASHVNANRLAEGIRELHLKDGSILSSRATPSGNQVDYPYFFCAQFSHRDEKVSGRKWIAEIGLRQDEASRPVVCTILLKTDEVSARVTDLIQVTRPKLVQQLIAACVPVGHTPGLNVKRLDEESAPAFLREVEREGREHPLVLVSCAKDGSYPVTPDRLRSILVGLADVVDVPASVDTFAIEGIVGRRYISFGGAINIIFPVRPGTRGLFCDTELLRSDEIASSRDRRNAIESEVLAVITHRTNLPYSWRHISLESVGQAVLRKQLARAIERANGDNHSDELTEYTELLEAADQELRSKDKELALVRSEYEAKNLEARRLEADIAGLKHALAGRQSSDDSLADEVVQALTPLRESVAAVLKANPSIQQAIELTASLYPERIVVLDTAITSAKESDRGGSRLGAKAIELMLKLASDYWQALADGKGDQQAKSVFGQNAYAANEASALSHEGKKRRTFSYLGHDFVMEKHLKHGVKDSLAETLRVHFEWVASERKIIIGHCGKHLDF
ncbi:hypothetical protein WS63_03460 [Burkholderia stagnalis]|uniref:hypothetical protein n=1 Tax=Burkholderia stagnalis TaxID=1503054 RepID=UPI0007579EFF|nr:hypothetical protein [Burkholderia stagnalis]KVD94705.1 hypothetical protein WS63_03460 [Burkholderia stagnalis]KVL93072.1 hypothetical protein WT03_18875 [Burkholderia stagnalis]KVL94769.1 hypothetical protein WT02_18045 [Burkholderia stagnalis]KVM13102.1 hypothetical protein WT04_11365 [Burkholderia stagnalis]